MATETIHRIVYLKAMVEVYRDRKMRARWRIVNKNGQITATSHQSFASLRNAKRAAERLIASVQESEVC